MILAAMPFKRYGGKYDWPVSVISTKKYGVSYNCMHQQSSIYLLGGLGIPGIKAAIALQVTGRRRGLWMRCCSDRSNFGEPLD
jgi:hypothetical protein